MSSFAWISQFPKLSHSSASHLREKALKNGFLHKAATNVRSLSRDTHPLPPIPNPFLPRTTLLSFNENRLLAKRFVDLLDLDATLEDFIADVHWLVVSLRASSRQFSFSSLEILLTYLLLPLTLLITKGKQETVGRHQQYLEAGLE